MSARAFTLTAITAAVLAIGWGTPVLRAGQSGEPGATAWSAPRTPDGQPDIQGFWANQGRRLATYDIEAGADPVHVLLSGNQTDDSSLVVDPPDGKIPYQPWARAK